MKKKSKKKALKRVVEVSVATGTVDGFFKRSLDRARILDRGGKLRAEIRLTFEDPADLVRVLSTQRIRVLRTVRTQPSAVSDLAHILKRDRKAVSRDVKVLESHGLVRTYEQPNPGHGLMRIVEPLAAKYQLVATI